MSGPLDRAGRLLRWFLRPFVSQVPSFYRAVTACLLAAGLFWQMNALNKTYTTRLNFPISWHYDSARYVPMRPLPAALPVTVTGQGWRLLRANLGWGTHPAELRPVPLPGTRYLPADGHHSLQNGLEGVAVTEWAGDTLRLTFDRHISRRLPLALRPDSAGTSYRARFTPAAVTFSGPATLVNALPNPYRVALPAAAARTAGEAEALVAPPARVRASVASVRLRILR